MLIGRSEGLGGLYSGIGPTLAMVVPQTALYFVCYDATKEAMEARGRGHVEAAMVSGALARGLAATVTSPLELIRTRMQAGVGKGLNGVVAIVSEGGFLGLWKGLAPTLWRDVPFSMVPERCAVSKSAHDA